VAPPRHVTAMVHKRGLGGTGPLRSFEPSIRLIFATGPIVSHRYRTRHGVVFASVRSFLVYRVVRYDTVQVSCSVSQSLLIACNIHTCFRNPLLGGILRFRCWSTDCYYQSAISNGDPTQTSLYTTSRSYPQSTSEDQCLRPAVREA
jgi:hypothetical protein